MKAYESVVGVPDQFVSLVREWVTTPKFSVSFNGEFGGLFQGEKGFYARRSSIPIWICIRYEGVFQADAADGE